MIRSESLAQKGSTFRGASKRTATRSWFRWICRAARARRDSCHLRALISRIICGAAAPALVGWTPRLAHRYGASHSRLRRADRREVPCFLLAPDAAGLSTFRLRCRSALAVAAPMVGCDLVELFDGGDPSTLLRRWRLSRTNDGIAGESARAS